MPAETNPETTIRGNCQEPSPTQNHRHPENANIKTPLGNRAKAMDASFSKIFHLWNTSQRHAYPGDPPGNNKNCSTRTKRTPPAKTAPICVNNSPSGHLPITLWYYMGKCLRLEQNHAPKLEQLDNPPLGKLKNAPNPEIFYTTTVVNPPRIQQTP